jgi:hypothetical protein
MDIVGMLKEYGVYVLSIVALFIIGIMSVTALIPLDSVPAVSGVTIITAIAYAFSVIVWLMAVFFIGRRGDGGDSGLTWLNTHLLLLVVFPATIAATAMNVTAVQNTRNLLAGRVAA